MSSILTPPRRIAILIFALLLIFFSMATQTAHAGPQPQEETTPTVKAVTEGTPALLLTPLPTVAAGEGQSSTRALVATVVLLMCGMVGMLVGGIGVAMIMVRLRNRVRGG